MSFGQTLYPQGPPLPCPGVRSDVLHKEGQDEWQQPLPWVEMLGP